MADSNQEIETPMIFVQAVEKWLKIRFQYDMAATEENSKAPRYCDIKRDAFKIDWPLDGWCWLNPPFRNLTKWIKKCAQEQTRGCQIVSIWFLSGDLNQIVTWKQAHVYIIHGRIWPEVRGCMLCVWSRNIPNKIIGLRWAGKELEWEWEISK